MFAGILPHDGNFYPRSPCGERHARGNVLSSYIIFLSTLSLRRATWLRCWQLAARDISIHALLAESDVSTTIITICIAVFLSTLSLRRATKLLTKRFSDTLISIHALLAESDVVGCGQLAQVFQISIHALLAESDGQCFAWLCMAAQFLSTLSLRRAT